MDKDDSMEQETAKIFTPEGIVLPDGLSLARDDFGLTLFSGDMALRCDLSDMIPRLRQQNLERELLIKACRIKGMGNNLKVVDGTAGMGEDALLLAAAGFEVTMFERNPVIALLLEDAVQRAQEMEELKEAANRMSLVKGDSINALGSLSFAPDVVYLDPMFPQRKKSAAVKKKFQLLHLLESPCQDESELLEAALAASPRKVVVKRPAKAPFLAGRKPGHSLEGKAIRYDVLIP